MPMPISLFGREEGGTREDGSVFSMQERAGEGAAASPSIMPETSTPASCCANRTKDEPKAAPEENGPGNPILEVLEKGVDTIDTPEAVQSMDSPDGAAGDCPQYPGGCPACPEYRGLTRWWCRRLHWWKPWPMPDGELPTVEVRQGHVQHVYMDGTTRLVGVAAAPTVPASVIPPLPGEASTVQETKASRWHKAVKGAGC